MVYFVLDLFLSHFPIFYVSSFLLWGGEEEREPFSRFRNVLAYCCCLGHGRKAFERSLVSQCAPSFTSSAHPPLAKPLLSLRPAVYFLLYLLTALSAEGPVQEVQILTWPFSQLVWPRTLCSSRLVSSSEMEIITPNVKMRVENETRAVCLAQGLDGEALDIYWFLPFYFCRCPSDPSDRRLIFLKLLLLSCYPPTPGFKHETQRSILINSVDEDFSIYFFIIIIIQ